MEKKSKSHIRGSAKSTAQTKSTVMKSIGRAVKHIAKSHRYADNPMRPTPVAFAVSQAIYAGQMAVLQDLEMIRRYSK